MAADDVDFDEVEYVTNRRLPNDDDELTGHILMYSYDEVTFHYTLECPFCGAVTEGSREMENRPYYIRCSECGENNLIRKMKGSGNKIQRPGGDTVGETDDGDV